MRTILVVGGGYAGFYTAWRLEKILRRDEARIVVVDPRPYMTYQPFLPEVLAGSVEARHAAVSLGHGRARVQAPARLLRRRGWRRVARLAGIAAIEEFRANGGRVGGPWAGTIREVYGGHRPRRYPRGHQGHPCLGDAHQGGNRG